MRITARLPAAAVNATSRTQSKQPQREVEYPALSLTQAETQLKLLDAAIRLMHFGLTA